MLEFKLTPHALRHDPDLAALCTLESALNAARHSLLAVYEKIEEEAEREGDVSSAEEAYAVAILHQISALEDTIYCYAQRLTARRGRTSPADDNTPWPF